jgi:hypothetical protein
MSASAAVVLRQEKAPGLLVAYAEMVQGWRSGRMPRGSAATPPGPCSTPTLISRCGWTGRHPARLPDLRRSRAWSFLCWCFREGSLRPDLDLLIAKTPGELYADWAGRHPDHVARLREVAVRSGRIGNWTRDLIASTAMIACGPPSRSGSSKEPTSNGS